MEKIIGKYPYIIAEIGANHNGSIDTAKRMVEEAKKAGCDAVKFQLWDENTAHTSNYIEEMCNKAELDVDKVKLSTPEHGLNNVRDQLRKYKFYKDEHVILKEFCDQLDIDFSSTAMNMPDIDFLNDLGVKFFKVAAQDTDNPYFLRKIAKYDVPTIVSTGLSTLAEIEEAVFAFDGYVDNLALLHTISLYPPDDNIVYLNKIKTLKSLFGVPVGFSDHTIGFSIPLASVALGAQIIEKHFTLDKNMPGWDHKVSANPTEMHIICKESKRIVDALGGFNRPLTENEEKKKYHFRMSIVTMRNLKKGDKIAEEDLWFKRPGTGIKPNELKYVIGRTLKHSVEKDSTLSWDDLQ